MYLPLFFFSSSSSSRVGIVVIIVIYGNVCMGGLSVYIPLVFLLACNYVVHLLFPIGAHVLGEPMLMLQLVY